MLKLIKLLAIYAIIYVIPIYAADDCEKLSFEKCLNEILQNANEEVSAQAESRFLKANKELKTSATGDVPLSNFGNELTLNDLLPLFNISFDPVTSGEENEAAGFSIEYSPQKEILV